MEKEQGLRFNSGKIRYDLLEPFAIEQLAKVFTKGAEKYAPNNWLKGLPWTDVTASLKRHLAEFEKGIDIDEETKLLHMAHVAWNALAIVSYYKHCPQFDNRRHNYLNVPKIGLDIDEVLCNWVDGWTEKFDLHKPTSWFFDYKIVERFADLKEKGELDEFYLGLNPLITPEEIPFEPHCYVTSRPVDTEITIKWLEKHKFQTRPVITVPVGTSKVEAIKAAGIEIFVDDRFENFVELNNAGICTYLYDSPHNQRYDVGYKRIYSLKELI